MNKLEYPWQQLYLAALTEVLPGKLSARVSAADEAVFERLLELEGSTGTDKERTALEETLGYLRLLRNHRYNFKD